MPPPHNGRASSSSFDKVGVARKKTIGIGPWGVKQEMLKERFRNIKGAAVSKTSARV
jgi:hypothetical protein